MPPTAKTPLLDQPAPTHPPKPTFRTFLASFWPLAFISFGGPQAHVALFIDRYVNSPTPPQIPESTFLELYALAQSLPGPGSTQLATALGATFGGVSGALITFFVWHFPGFLAMSAAGVWFHSHISDRANAALIQSITDHAVGLISAAFAFVLLAAFKIVSKVCAGDGVKMGIALVCMFIAISIPAQMSSWVFIALLVGGGVFYYVYSTMSQGGQQEDVGEMSTWDSNVSTVAGVVLLGICLVMTLIIAVLPGSHLGFRVLKIFWRIGLSVFGGGIVVVPMLLNEFVESGLVPTGVFLAGFGLFGCIPGPMFNLAPFLGAAVLSWPGAFYGSLGLFGPGILLQLGLLPFWERIRKFSTAQIVLQGTNSAAAGLIMGGVWMLLKKALVGPSAFALTCVAGAFATVYGIGPATNIVVTGVLGLVLVTLNIGGPFHEAA